MSRNAAQKRGSSRQRLKWGSERGTLRQARCSSVSLRGGGSELIASVVLCQSRIHTGRARLFLCLWSPSAFAHPWSDTHSSQPGPAPRAPLLRQIFNPCPRPHWTGREGMDRSHLYQTLPRKTFSHHWHSHTLWLLVWRPQHIPSLDRIEPMPATKFRKDSTKPQSKPTSTQQKYVWSPIPCPCGTEQPLGFTSQKNDAMNTMYSKKPYLYFLKQNKTTKTPRENAKCFQEFFPFIPDYMIYLAPVWISPLAYLCPLFNLIAGFYSKTSFSKE